jgi:hypothetical protein
MRSNPRLRTFVPQTTPNSLISQCLSGEAFGAGAQKVESTRRVADCHKEILAPGFLIQAIEILPPAAGLRREKKVLWVETECGCWAELDGADHLYQLQMGVVIAVVGSQARLTLFDGERHVEVPAGIWRIAPQA